MIVKVGTRGSLLALTQTNFVIERLRAAYPENDYETVVIKTTGDKDLSKPLDQIGSKGLFVDEIEKELLEGTIQLAVHSMKDMPEAPLEGLTFAKPIEREDPRDVLILNEGNSLSDLRINANVATGSKRRSYQLLRLRPDINILPIRGNIDTRLRKLKEGLDDGTKLDGIVLAAAGLNRLKIKPEHIYYFSEEEIVPAPAQGTLALEYRSDNIELGEMLDSISDEDTHLITQIERGFLKEIGGDCHLPVGAYAKKLKNEYELLALFGNEDGTKLEKTIVKGNNVDKLIKAAVDNIHSQLEE